MKKVVYTLTVGLEVPDEATDDLELIREAFWNDPSGSGVTVLSEQWKVSEQEAGAEWVWF